MFHWATGIPFQSEEHAGAYDELTFWEQIDNGEQYTPTKKFLICTPIVLYVIPSSGSPPLPNTDVPAEDFYCPLTIHTTIPGYLQSTLLLLF